MRALRRAHRLAQSDRMTDEIVLIHDIDSISSEWSELAALVGACPFAYPEWIAAWWSAFGSGRLEILTVHRDRRLVGVLPLQRRFGELESTTNWHTPSFEALACDESAARALASAAAERARGRLDLSFVADDATIVRSLRTAAGERSMACAERIIQRSPYIDLDGEWDQYLMDLPSRKRRKLRRAREALAEQGEVTFELDDGSGDLDGALRTGFEIESAGWKGDEGTAIVSQDSTRRFYESVARWAAGRGWLRLAFLRLDGRPIAFGFAIEDDTAHYDLKNGFLPECADLSPGFLLAAARIEHSFEAGLDRYEFLGNAERHKLDWTDAIHERRRLQLFPPNLRGRVERAAWTHLRPIAKRIVARARRGRGASAP